MKDRMEVMGEGFVGQVVKEVNQALGNAAIAKELKARGRTVRERKQVETTEASWGGDESAGRATARPQKRRH